MSGGRPTSAAAGPAMLPLTAVMLDESPVRLFGQLPN